MKNVLGIKRISSVLLVGTMVFANSPIKTEASNSFLYIAYNPKTGTSEMVDDNQKKGNTPIEDAVCPEDKGAKFVYNGELVDGRTPISEVPGCGKNILVAYHGKETATSIWKATEDARTPRDITFGVYDMNTGKASSYGTYVYPSEMINDIPREYYHGNENEVRFLNGEKVDGEEEFGPYLNKNGNNVLMTFTNANPNILPQ